MKLHAIILCTSILFLSACQKDKDDPLSPTPVASVCGIDGFRLQANFGGSEFCPNASLFADAAAGTLIVSGIDLQGRTLSLELDSLNVGSYAMSSGTNSILFTNQLALAYLSSDSDPGVLTITSHDMVQRRIRGTFSAELASELSAAQEAISGSFDLSYLE